MSAYVCTEVSPQCPVQATTLGYYPNLALNGFILAAFALAMIIQLVLGVWKKTWSFSAFIVLGCALEAAGGCILSLPLSCWNCEQETTRLLSRGFCAGHVR